MLIAFAASGLLQGRLSALAARGTDHA